MQFIYSSWRQGLYHPFHTVNTWRSETRFVPSISYSSSMALRDKVCTIHLMQFIHISWRQGLYHPSHTVHTAHHSAVLYIWCDGHGSQRQGFVPSISYSSYMVVRDKVCTIHFIQVIHGAQRQGLYHLSCAVHPWLSETRFVPSISYSSYMALRDKVCTIHLIQFILPIAVVCYIYGAMAMALRDKVCTFQLVQFIHGSQRQGFVPSISYSSYCLKQCCVIHMVRWPWLSETRFVPSNSYSSSMTLRDKVCAIHLVQLIHSSQRQGLYHPSHTVHPQLLETRFVPSISYSSYCPSQCCVIYMGDGHGSQRQGFVPSISCSSYYLKQCCVIHMVRWPWLSETRFVPSNSFPENCNKMKKI